MNWFYSKDMTSPIISANVHINSGHGNSGVQRLPHTCVIFEIGMAMRHIEATFNTKTIIEKLPCFLDNPKCIAIEGINNVCFTRGGYGAPAAVDTLETLHALGVQQFIVAGMCGVFSENANVGDLIIPHKIYSEEGTSQHYFENQTYAIPNEKLYKNAIDFFHDDFIIHNAATVTSDAVYRQTFYKEALWRKKGCVGVDMESSALLSVSQYYGLPAVSLLLASDKHPLSEKNPVWEWGNKDFDCIKVKFVNMCIDFASNYTKNDIYIDLICTH